MRARVLGVMPRMREASAIVRVFGRSGWSGPMFDARAGVSAKRKGGTAVATIHPVVFLFDVDNTLLDNDQVVRDLGNYLERRFGAQGKERYFAVFEELRAQVGYADYLGALQRYRAEYPTDHRLLEVSSFLVDYPFANRLYPNSLDVLRRCAAWGPTVVLSDGDVVFQPRKVERSSIRDTVEGRVLIYVHKEKMLADVEANFPAAHYVLVDDKVRILDAVKKQWGERVTTVFPVQGHYALDAKAVASYPAPDVRVERIGEMLGLEREMLMNAGSLRR
jgi:FMN phosphatase YigB (HAD superfamily)